MNLHSLSEPVAASQPQSAAPQAAPATTWEQQIAIPLAKTLFASVVLTCAIAALLAMWDMPLTSVIEWSVVACLTAIAGGICYHWFLANPITLNAMLQLGRKSRQGEIDQLTRERDALLKQVEKLTQTGPDAQLAQARLSDSERRIRTVALKLVQMHHANQSTARDSQHVQQAGITVQEWRLARKFLIAARLLSDTGEWRSTSVADSTAKLNQVVYVNNEPMLKH